jgi:hypothetical protein
MYFVMVFSIANIFVLDFKLAIVVKFLCLEGMVCSLADMWGG